MAASIATHEDVETATRRLRCCEHRRPPPLTQSLAVTRVAVLDDYQGRAPQLADWGSLGPGIEVEFFAEPIARQRLAERLAGYEALVLMRERTRLDAAVLAQLPRLELVVTTGMRNASLDVDYLRERGVVVCGTAISAPGGGGVPTTTEVAWALILATLKRVTIEDRALRSGRWQTDLPATLAGATLGLAGLGRLGASMVGPARAFGMEVIAWSQNLTTERAQEVGVQAVSKEDLLHRSDVLSIHLVLSDRTRGLFGAAELSQMRSGAVLINTSRGPIVDEGALIAALRDGTIAAAGLDVYDTEPLPPGHPLTGLENAVLLPHLGYVTEPTLRHMYEQAVEDIAAWRHGAPIRTLY
jgi:phosphoglycerate dehydrogenase-like enzyme